MLVHKTCLCSIQRIAGSLRLSEHTSLRAGFTFLDSANYILSFAFKLLALGSILDGTFFIIFAVEAQ